MAQQQNILPVHRQDASGSSASGERVSRHSEERSRKSGEHKPRHSHQGHHHPHIHHPHMHHPHIKARKNALSGYMSNKWRNEIVAAIAEFAGTFMFLFFAFGGTQVANTAALYSNRATAGQQGNSLTQAPDTSVLLYISLIFGFSLMVCVWVFFRVSGGLFNPAVSCQHHDMSSKTLRLTSNS
jgi:aquaporin related protein